MLLRTIGSVFAVLGNASRRSVDPLRVDTIHLEDEESTPADEAEARKEVIEEYANSLREVIKVIRNSFN
jgi:hypothetical protein